MLLFMMHFKYAALGNYTQTALLTVQGSFLQINVLGFSQEMTRKTLSTLLGVHLYLKYICASIWSIISLVLYKFLSSRG